MASDHADAPEPPIALLAPGQLIDGFRVQALLHQGGMAQLWRVVAVDSDEALPLIMKVPRTGTGDDPAAIVGFEVEQMILPALSGPHVPRFVARSGLGQRPYIVMERIDGPSLLPRLEAAPLPLAEV
ncbi:MAG: serine/threonine protein kinase, partial [Rubrivivax sp.]|nr:serine/threonine protein kinase [Rubrivivax sp.]